MPSGRYLLHDPYDGRHTATEHFQCAPGPSGWRYAARTTTPDGAPLGSVDLTTDRRFRPLRLELHAGHWRVRGAALDGVSWVRTDPTGTLAREGNAPARGFTGTSPAFLIALARQLAPEPGGGAVPVRLVHLTEPVLAPRTVEQLWSHTGTEHHDADHGTLRVDHFRVGLAETGELGDVHLAGDVVLAAPGVELDALDGPPSVLDVR